jgi:hypothetical protein
VAERDHRHVDADERADLTRVHAGSVDHDFALDPSLVGLDGRDAAVARLDSGHLRAYLDPRPEAAGAVRQRERQLGRIEVAVIRDERCAEHAVGGKRREEPLCILRRDDLHRQPERSRPRRLPPDLLHPRL